jgi:predicted Zn finger-like uncharacterized protein
MDRTECPECRHVVRIKRERLGQRVKCPNCEHVFQSEAAGLPLDRLARADHPVGLWSGIVLLVIAAVVGVGGMLTADTTDGPTLGPVALNVTVISAVVGGLLIARYCVELSRRPVPVGRRAP